MRLSFSCAVALFSGFSLSAFASGSDYPWKAAVAMADITPEAPVWMSGYAARKGPSEKVMQRLFAKVLTIEDAEGGRMVFVTWDLIGVPRVARDEIEKRAREKHGVKPAQLLINASHTHSGPMIRVYRPPNEGKPFRAPYANIPEEDEELRVGQTLSIQANLIEAVDRMIGETVSSLQPARLAWSHSKCGFAMNRRARTDAGGWRIAPNSDAPVDHDVPVLQVWSRDEKPKLMTVLFGYACHATVLSVMEINGDWPGYAQQFFEADHPGTVCMFLNGCSGDQNPYPRRFVPYVERHGRTMTTAIEAALEAKPNPLAGPLRSALAWPEIPYQKPPTRKELEARTNSKDKREARQAIFLLEYLDTAGSLPKSYPVPVQVIRFGDSLAIAAIGGEVVVDYALRLKRELPELTGEAPVWIAGYSNDVMTYIPSRRVLEEGGYEGKTAMRAVRTTVHPASWTPEIEEMLVAEVMRLAKATAP